MVETQFPIVVMNHPRRRFDTVPISFEIKANNYLAFFGKEYSYWWKGHHQKKFHDIILFLINKDLMILSVNKDMVAII